jgi:hypothetical protein
MPRISAKASTFGESVIREMSRLAVRHGANNLAQGFPDFAAPAALKDAACAMQMAVRCSVTVSIGEDTSGIFMRMPGVSCAERSTSLGCTDEGPGTRRTSSKVRPSRMTARPEALGSCNAFSPAGGGRAL